MKKPQQLLLVVLFLSLFSLSLSQDEETDTEEEEPSPFAYLLNKYVKIPYTRGKDTRYTLIGTLDNTLPDDEEVGGQSGALLIPEGWKLASKDSSFEEALREQGWTFGTECLLYEDGTGVSTDGDKEDCGPGILEETHLEDDIAYSVPDSAEVASRILITKDASFKVPEAPCGLCEVWGDPHVQPFDKDAPEYISAQEGTYIYYASTAEVEPSFEISYTQFQVGYASAVNHIFIRYDTDIVEFQVEDDSVRIYRGGQPLDLNNDFRGQILVSNPKPDLYKVMLPNHVLLSINRLFFTGIPYLTSIIAAPNSLSGMTEGICGTCGESYYEESREDIYTYFEKPELSKRQVIDSEKTENKAPKGCPNGQLRAYAEWACRGSTRALMDACVFDVCMTGSSEMSQSYFDSTGHSSAAIMDSDCQEAQITTVASFHGYEFAVLETAPGVQEEYLSLPESWELARDTPFTRAFIASGSLGTSCLTLREGVSLNKDLQVCEEETLLIRPGKCFKSKSESRVLVYRQPEVSFFSKKHSLFTPNPDGTVSGWTPVGKGYTTSKDTLVRVNRKVALRIVAETAEETGASFTGQYNSHRPFSVGVWSKSNKAVRGNNSQYGFKVELEYEGGRKVLAAQGLFNPMNTEYNFRSVDVYPTGHVLSVTLTLFVSGFPGTDVSFSSLYVSSEIGLNTRNFLSNPTFQGESSWKSLKEGFSFDESTDHSQMDKSGSIKIAALTPSVAGASQVIELSEEEKKNVEGIYFRGFSLMSELKGQGASLSVSIKYEDGSRNELAARFDSELLEKGWRGLERVMRIGEGRVMKSIEFTMMVQGGSGTAHFDDLYLTLLKGEKKPSVEKRMEAPSEVKQVEVRGGRKVMMVGAVCLVVVALVVLVVVVKRRREKASEKKVAKLPITVHDS